jgi:glutamine amidotransferase
MKEVILVDAGTGNLRSVQKALEVLARMCCAQILRHKAGLIWGCCAARRWRVWCLSTNARELESVIKDVAARVPLRICVGMQALFDVGEEMGEHAGLGLLAGKVVRFAESLRVKIPHTGWNQLEVRTEACLFDGINSGAHVYFNHSYYCEARNSSDVIARTDYGLKYACAVQRENIFGVQFHPEKSQAVGLRILKNFLEAA